jgi:hypothetical protein
MTESPSVKPQVEGGGCVWWDRRILLRAQPFVNGGSGSNA